MQGGLQAKGFFSSAPQLLEVWCLKANGRSENHQVGQVEAVQPKWTCRESHSDVWCQAGEMCLAAKDLGFKCSDEGETGQQ